MFQAYQPTLQIFEVPKECFFLNCSIHTSPNTKRPTMHSCIFKRLYDLFFFKGVGGTWDMFRCVLYSQALNFESNIFSVSFESSGQQCFSRSDGWNYKVRSKIIWRSCQRYPSEILLSCFSQLLYRLCRDAEINQFLVTWYFATFLNSSTRTREVFSMFRIFEVPFSSPFHGIHGILYPYRFDLKDVLSCVSAMNSLLLPWWPC